MRFAAELSGSGVGWRSCDTISTNPAPGLFVYIICYCHRSLFFICKYFTRFVLL